MCQPNLVTLQLMVLFLVTQRFVAYEITLINKMIFIPILFIIPEKILAGLILKLHHQHRPQRKDCSTYLFKRPNIAHVASFLSIDRYAVWHKIKFVQQTLMRKNFLASLQI